MYSPEEAIDIGEYDAPERNSHYQGKGKITPSLNPTVGSESTKNRTFRRWWNNKDLGVD
jgi:hypothetical protein